MSVIYTGTNQGSFRSDGTAKTLILRSDVDYLHVYNQTVLTAAGANTGAQFYWQRGMATGLGNIYTKTVGNTLQIGQVGANAGFYLIDSSSAQPSAPINLTGIDAGTLPGAGPGTAFVPPTVFTAPAGTIVNGDIVRIFQTAGALQLGSMDFTVGAVGGASFTLLNMVNIVNANPGAGSWRKIPYDPIFYPRNRYITNICQATSLFCTAAAGMPALMADQAIISMSVTHGFTVGQKVRFVIPYVTAARYGMTELDGVEATIIAVGDLDNTGVITNTIRVAVDVSGYTAFATPLTTDRRHTFAQVVPVGQDTALTIDRGYDQLGNALRNTGFIGITLMAGANSPAGVAGNTIYWVAGKSYSNLVE